jgi:hypothetical protein
MPSSPDAGPAGRPRATILGAWLEGWRRVMAAPRITVGVLLLTWVVALPLAAVLRDRIATHLGDSMTAGPVSQGWDRDWAGEFATSGDGVGGTFTYEILGFGGTLAAVGRLLDGPAPPRALLGAIAAYVGLWLFLLGGIIDRYARARPVRPGAFFATSGVFFLRFLRLSLVIGAIDWLLFRGLRPWLFGPVFDAAVRDLANEHQALVVKGWLYAAFLAAVGLVSLWADIAKVRAVVEDRHSALASLGAAARFIRRRFWRCSGLYLLNIVGLLVMTRLWLQIAPTASDPSWLALLAAQAYLVARLWGKLAFVASEVVFFQGELAHAQYTARPEPLWPDSPAVEAIRNLSRGPRG